MRSRWAILILLLAGIVSYANTVGNGLFWDDDEFITRNAYIRSFKFIPQWFTTPVTAGAGVNSNYYRPLLTASFSLDYHLWGLWSAGYHLENLLWHTAAAILLYFFLKELLREFGIAPTVALATAALWLVHPAHVEAVAYANSRGDSMATVFIFLSLMLWMKKRIRGSALAFIAALLSKEFAIVTPGLILLIESLRGATAARQSPDYRSLRNFQSYIEDKRSSLIYITNLASKKLYGLLTIVVNLYNFTKPALLHFAIAAIYLVLRLTVLNFQNTLNFYDSNLVRPDFCTIQRPDICPPIELYATSLKVRMLTFFKVLPIYAGILVWPTDLHMERTVEIATTAADKTVILAAAVVIVIIFAMFKGLTLAYAKVRPYQIPLFASGWLFISILPVSGIIPISQILAEHFLYLPSIGVFLLVAFFIVSVSSKISTILFRNTQNTQKSGYPQKIRQPENQKFGFSDSLTIRASGSLSFPSVLGGKSLSIVLTTFIALPLITKTISQNRVWRDPITFYEYTLTHTQPTARIYNNLAMAYADAKDYQKAMSNYQLAISLGDVYPNPHYNLGNTFLKMRNVEEAEKEYRRALEIDPNFHFATLKLGQIYLNQGKTEEAVNLVCPAFPQQPLCRQGSRP